jgi:hypothetical protein
VRSAISENAAQPRWPRPREICTYVHAKSRIQSAVRANQEIESHTGSFEKMVDRSHASSTPPAILPAVARNRDDLENPEKAAIDLF